MKKKENKINIIIVDDHCLFNDGLNAMLQLNKDINVLTQVYDSREAADKIHHLTPDVILIDFNMPHINGIELTKMILEKSPDSKIMILTMYNEERHINEFKKNGIKGYLFKTASSEEVVNAIKKIDSGEFYFPEFNTKNNHAEDEFLKKLKISNREIEVINLVKEGLKTKEIADKLNISYYTAETHRKNIKLKLGLKGEEEFIKFIYRNSFNVKED